MYKKRALYKRSTLIGKTTLQIIIELEIKIVVVNGTTTHFRTNYTLYYVPCRNVFNCFDIKKYVLKF